MPDIYKGQRIAELLDELRRAELVFNDVNSDQLSTIMLQKLVRAQTTIALTKAKLTSLQEDHS